MAQTIDLIVNAHSGTGPDVDAIEQIKSAFTDHDLDAKIHFARSGDELERFAKQAASNGSSIVAAAGGDGTISAVAGHLAETDKSLGVIPLGTLNNFSKDLGIPQTVEEAVQVLADGVKAEVDVAEVNGHRFINNSSIGLYPRIVRRREQQQRLGRGKWIAAGWAALKVFRLSHFLTVRIVTDDSEFVSKTPFVFVGNNDYDMDLYNIGRRPRLDEGKLSVYFLKRGGRWGVIVMLLKTLVGRVKQWKDFEEIQTTSLTILSKRKQLFVALDGEVTSLDTPLEYTIMPKALKVVVPRTSES